MTAALPAGTRNRLVKLLGLLSSDFEGERANAGRMADQLLRSHGLRWDDVLVPEERPAAEIGWFWHRLDHRAVALTLLEVPVPWSPWEAEFLGNLCHRRRISPKQTDVLRRLARRAGLEDAF